ncbi:hypothetical protein [Gordonia sihwensis]|uniref:hypothetical protein n=1 Tax=Gordonia sihwensis TaxID=173559 RepID=UPI0012E07D81|nr:hypothetical protein [Gordonia sihwensis]
MNPSLAELTADLTRTVTALLDRRDVVVVLDPGLPVDGQFNAATAQIAINLERICDPDTVTALQDRSLTVANVERLHGVLAHEAGHAAHTPIRPLPPHLVDWVELLEEPRIEATVVRQRPEVAESLSAAAAPAVGNTTPTDAIGAIETLILVGGRITAGVFTATADYTAMLDAARTILDADDTTAIEDLTATALQIPDDDLAVMVRAAQQLFDIASRYGAGGRAGTTVHHVTGRESSDVDDSDDPATNTDGDPDASQTADDDRGATGTDEADDGNAPAPDDADQPDLAGVTAPAVRGAEQPVQEVPTAYIDGDPQFFSSTVTGRADDWFTVCALPDEASSHRPVTNTDRAGVRALQSWLVGHSIEAPVDTVVASRLPRGRLNTTELMQATAQQELGLQVTATPWRRRRTVEHPAAPLELGIICDRSQSMSRHLESVAAVAWTLQHSIVGARGRSRAWVFGADAHVLPEQRGDRITIPTVDAHTLALLPAIVDYQRWARPEHAAKVLIVISDGALYGDPVRDHLVRLAATGVKIIGITPRPSAVDALANHLPAGSPIEVLGANLLTQIQQHLVG